MKSVSELILSSIVCTYLVTIKTHLVYITSIRNIVLYTGAQASKN